MKFYKGGQSMKVTLQSKKGVVDYEVNEFETNFNGRGFRLQKVNNEDHYNVFICNQGHDQDTCDCADATFRERRCKHIDAVRAILVAATQSSTNKE